MPLPRYLSLDMLKRITEIIRAQPLRYMAPDGLGDWSTSSPWTRTTTAAAGAIGADHAGGTAPPLAGTAATVASTRRLRWRAVCNRAGLDPDTRHAPLARTENPGYRGCAGSTAALTANPQDNRRPGLLGKLVLQPGTRASANADARSTWKGQQREPRCPTAHAARSPVFPQIASAVPERSDDKRVAQLRRRGRLPYAGQCLAGRGLPHAGSGSRRRRASSVERPEHRRCRLRARHHLRRASTLQAGVRWRTACGACRPTGQYKLTWVGTGSARTSACWTAVSRPCLLETFPG